MVSRTKFHCSPEPWSQLKTAGDTSLMGWSCGDLGPVLTEKKSKDNVFLNSGFAKSILKTLLQKTDTGERR